MKHTRRYLFVVLIAIAAGCGGPPAYQSFLTESPPYHSKIAQACDELLSQRKKGTLIQSVPKRQEIQVGQPSPDVADHLSISGDSNVLPQTLRALHSSAVLVSSNRVYIRIGPMTRAGWGIIWEQNDGDSALWELSTNGDGKHQVVYSERKIVLSE